MHVHRAADNPGVGSARDAGFLAGARSRRVFAAGDEIRDGGSPAGAFLFLEGAAELLAETPFGPHPVARVAAPALADLRAALGGSSGVSRLRPQAGTEAVFLSAEDARALAFDAGEAGGAFRRIALASLTTAIRDTNASLAQFFEGLSVKPVPPDPTRAHTVDSDVDLARARDLFETAGLDPAILPALGLTARTVMPGAALVKRGDAGHEAFLLVEGRLRVSLDIAGAGEEALAILKPGEIVGEMGLVDDAPRSADVYAHGGPAVVYILTREVFQRLLGSGAPEGAPLLGGLTFLLARRLEEAIKKAAGFRILSGPI
jgi:CRP/FNR family transcriptional regulator, cyclic AMP receptor protein